MPFVVAECDPQEISFFDYSRAFRVYDLRSTAIGSVHPGLILAEQLRGNRVRGTATHEQGLSVFDAAITRWSCYPCPSEVGTKHGPVGARSYSQLG